MRHVKIVMTVGMIDETTRKMSTEKLEQIREGIPVMAVEVIYENTRERIAEELLEMIEKLE